MMGLLAAVERYLTLDHEARNLRFETMVDHWNKGLSGLQGITAQRDFPNEAGQPTPRTLVSFSDRFARDDIIRQLWEGNPCIAVAPAEPNGIYLNPMTVSEGEAEIVLGRLLEVLV
jgi:D-glucosaminate-6-phosphate ammonia-lyase